MCGIAGYYSSEKSLPGDVLRKMTASLAHRGPDSEGFYSDETISLGIRRLRVVDVSSYSDQPIYSADERYVMAYNGEVYNYLEIANEIRACNPKKNVSLDPSSDSHIILEAFVQWGTAFVHKLNGMFAIAIYDKTLKKLYLFQDRVGMKPLYYCFENNYFAFSSEIKSLLQLPFLSPETDPHAIYQYFHFGFIPAPNSIYKNIMKMTPGTFIVIKNGIVTNERYWRQESFIKAEMVKNETQALVQLGELLKSSVNYQLNSNVPVGIFLSGGIDSTLITALSSNLSSVKTNTYSIGFSEEEFNELPHTRRVAEYLGTNHHEYIVSHKNALPMVDMLADTFGEPFADSSAIPMLLLSQVAAQSVTVALSGEGADELFFGYGSYRWAQRLNNPFVKTARKPIAGILRKMGGRFKRIAEHFEYESPSAIYSHINSREGYYFLTRELENNILSPAFKARLMDSADWPYNLVNVAKNKRPLTAAEKQSIFDLMVTLPNDLLVQADRTSMRHSLEIRLPFLDHRIIEYATNLSPHLKMKGNVSKYILKKLLKQHVPSHLTDRPKQGFSVPISKWLLKEWKGMINETLSEEIIGKYEIADIKSVKKLISDFRKGDTWLYSRIWQLIILHKWLIKNNTI